VTSIVAPAMLTNASSVLAMSTINRLLRTRERMASLYDKSETQELPDAESTHLVDQVDRVERQAMLLLGSMRAIYVALGAFAAATLVTLFGAVTEHLHAATTSRVLTQIGMALGTLGVCALIAGSVNLFRATRISIINISEEAAMIRARQAKRVKGGN
jgi:hypothetical protein